MRMPVLLSMASLLAVASPAGVEGKWKAHFLGDPGKWPKTVAEMTFEFQVSGRALEGTAHIGSWPGDAAIQDGKVEDGKVKFVVIGKDPSTVTGPMGAGSGYPRLTFSGTIDGDDMQLHLVWDSIVIYGEAGKPQEYDITGRPDRE